MKTLLLFALPCSGKTTWVKQQNKGFKIQDRPVIDFDYKGPRRMTPKIAAAQSQLLNAWAETGVKAITTFPQFLDFKSLDNNLFEIVFVLPFKDSTLKVLTDRALERSKGVVGSFEEDYVKNIKKYKQEWLKIYNDLVVEDRFGVHLFPLDMGDNLYFSNPADAALRLHQQGIFEADATDQSIAENRNDGSTSKVPDNIPISMKNLCRFIMPMSHSVRFDFVKPSKAIPGNRISQNDHIHVYVQDDGTISLGYHYVGEYSQYRKSGAMNCFNTYRKRYYWRTSNGGEPVTVQQFIENWNQFSRRGKPISLVVDIWGTKQSWASSNPIVKTHVTKEVR